MRIAFDGEFERLPVSGIGGYVRNLTAELQAAAPDLDLAIVRPEWDHTGLITPGLLHDRRLQRASWEMIGFAKAARAVVPDLLHIPSFAAPLRPTRPIVVTIHDVIPFVLPEYRTSWPMRMHMEIMRRTVRRASIIIAPSHSAAGEIERVLHTPASRIRVTHEAAGDAYRPAADPRVNDALLAKVGIRGRYIFNVGGLDVRKNVPMLIEAFAKIQQQAPEPLQLVIAGAAHSANLSVFPPLDETIRRFGLADSVILTGRVSEDEKIGLYQSAALYVTPSAHEGFGLTALEAMACGIPTIAANCTSFPEVVGDDGMLVEINPEAIAAAMLKVLNEPAFAADLGVRGLARAATFSWRRTAMQTLDVYREVLTNSRH